MTEENILRFVLLFATVVQTGISIYYLRQAGAAATLFKHRQAGLLLTGAIVLSYAAYGLIVVAVRRQDLRTNRLSLSRATAIRARA